MAASIETNDNIEQDAIVFANNIASFVAFPFAIRSAIELGIFKVLAKLENGMKLSAKEIAIQIGSKNPEASTMLDRLLRLLANHSILHCSLFQDQHQPTSPQIVYSLAPVAEYFVCGLNNMSFISFLDLTLDKVSIEAWTGLKGAIMEGNIPFNRVYGMHMYEYAGVDPRFNDIFNKAMLNFTTILMNRVLECYKGFEHINTIVDVGGGLGINLNLITSKYSHIQGVNFDLPHVIENATTYAGVTHVGGDMFVSVPKGDVIFMKWILHNWNDEQCVKLLKNCYKAIPNDGKVIVVESILPILPDNTIISKTCSQIDLNMMVYHEGGKERTKNEFIELALKSGFSGIKFAICVSGMWVMEFFK
ncbi:unnamed protein product [Trifolium pratense]|uniref:Uncharacterized protein n=1 Tax=Trifolium pratense TaxID=57577 RepID=A0ACB0L298_TRIPR|nr:unnamed protein product [Trifolium pratense]